MADNEKTRSVQTVFENKSGSQIINGIMKLNGIRDGFNFTLTSILSTDASNTLESLMKVAIDLTDVYSRSMEYGYNEKLVNKLRTKFAKYNNMELTTDNNQKNFIVFNFQNEEFITSPKKAIKLEKHIGIYTRTLKSVVSYIDKMIANKVERQKALAEKRANKAAIAKEAAESIAPGIVTAAPIASEAVTGTTV